MSAALGGYNVPGETTSSVGAPSSAPHAPAAGHRRNGIEPPHPAPVAAEGQQRPQTSTHSFQHPSLHLRAPPRPSTSKFNAPRLSPNRPLPSLQLPLSAMAGAPKRRRASATPSHTHIWPLGALAELVHVAGSTQTPAVWIDAHTPPDADPYLTIRDAGPGLSAPALRDLLRVPTPLSSWPRAGAYASPWQAAALRLGADLVVLSRTREGAAHIALLSRTRLAESAPPALAQPTLVLDWGSVTPRSPQLAEFLVYSPWDSYDAMCAAFAAIPPSGGTCVVVHSLKRNPGDAELELDLHADPRDILCAAPASSASPGPADATAREQPAIRLTRSLRAYLELLYLAPTFRIFLRGAIVRERRLKSMMWAPNDFCYTPRTRGLVDARPRDAGCATFRFGFDPDATPAEFGMLLYCRGRLIRPYLKVGLQAQPGLDVRVVGIVEAEFVTPTPNMQSFERDKYYQGLMFSLDRSLKVFWARYGSMSKVMQMHEKDSVSKWTRCDDCGKWRIVSQRCPGDPGDVISCPKWVCAMNVGGTVECGEPDDEDVKVVSNRKRMPVSMRQTLEASEPQKRRRTGSSEGSQDKTVKVIPNNKRLPTLVKPTPNASVPQRRPRGKPNQTFPFVPLLDNGQAHRMSRSENENAGSLALAQTVRSSLNDMSSPILLQEPQLDLDGPTPELIPPGMLEFSGEEFSLSRRMGSQSRRPERPTNGTSALGVSTMTRRKVAYVPPDADQLRASVGNFAREASASAGLCRDYSTEAGTRESRILDSGARTSPPASKPIPASQGNVLNESLLADTTRLPMISRVQRDNQQAEMMKELSSGQTLAQQSAPEKVPCESHPPVSAPADASRVNEIETKAQSPPTMSSSPDGNNTSDAKVGAGNEDFCGLPFARRKQPESMLTPPDTLAVATEAAASAARVVLNDPSLRERQIPKGAVADLDKANILAWSNMAFSAAIAAAAAATAATATNPGAINHSDSGKQSDEMHSATQSPGRAHILPVPSAQELRKAEVYRSKLQEVVCFLAPGAGGGMASWMHNVEELDAEELSQAVLDKVSQKERDKAEREVYEQMESFRVSQQIACESLQNIRHLVRLFLDKVVGVLRIDEHDEPVESQLEEYLRVFDVLPS